MALESYQSRTSSAGSIGSPWICSERDLMLAALNAACAKLTCVSSLDGVREVLLGDLTAESLALSIWVGVTAPR